MTGGHVFPFAGLHAEFGQFADLPLQAFAFAFEFGHVLFGGYPLALDRLPLLERALYRLDDIECAGIGIEQPALGIRFDQ